MEVKIKILLLFIQNGFSFEENTILKNILKDKFNIEAKISKTKSYFYLLLNKENTIKLNNIIKDHVIECMKYKLIAPQRLNAKIKT